MSKYSPQEATQSLVPSTLSETSKIGGTATKWQQTTVGKYLSNTTKASESHSHATPITDPTSNVGRPKVSGHKSELAGGPKFRQRVSGLYVT